MQYTICLTHLALVMVRKQYLTKYFLKLIKLQSIGPYELKPVSAVTFMPHLILFIRKLYVNQGMQYKIV